jgi:hypothetical protein
LNIFHLQISRRSKLFGCVNVIAGSQFRRLPLHRDYFVGAAGAAVAAGAWNNFMELSSVLYTPHPSGTPTNNQARKIIPADDFFTASGI